MFNLWQADLQLFVSRPNVQFLGQAEVNHKEQRKNIIIDEDVTWRRKETDVRRLWVLTSLIDVQADEKMDFAAMTSSLKPKKQPTP